ncbi:MAG TPA: site-specific integrase [Acidocella sp.]|nr:site-specific integrase [Acidocella sp.]
MAKRAEKRVSLTAKLVDKLECAPGRTETVFWDSERPGLGLRCRAGGGKAWVVRYTFQGRQRKAALGDVDTVALERARIEATRIMGGAITGHDVVAAKHAIRDADTIGELIADYLKDAERRLKPSTLLDLRRHLERHAKPLHGLKVVERTRVARLIDQVRQGGGVPRPAEAKALRASLSALFSWAIGCGRYDQANPVLNIPAGKPVVRDRVLTKDEIKLFWQATDDGTDAHRVIRLMLLTGQRESEVGGMRWSELSREGDLVIWTIPAERSKNKREHVVPLTPLAAEHLPPRPGSLFDAAGVERPIFGRRKASDSTRTRKNIRTRTTGRFGFSAWSRTKREVDKAMLEALHKSFVKEHGKEPSLGEAKIKPWRWHDLRRTVATCMNDIGIEPHIVEAILNHHSGSRGGVAGVYNHSTYHNQKITALRAYENYISKLVLKSERDDLSNVVVLRLAT